MSQMIGLTPRIKMVCKQEEIAQLTFTGNLLSLSMHFRHLDLRESVVGSILHTFNTNETRMSIGWLTFP